YDIIIINEQVLQGLHNSYFQKSLTEVMRASGNRELWLTDSRKLQDVYTHTIHKLNNHEARELYASYHQQIGNYQQDGSQQDGKAEGNDADKETSSQKIRNIHDRDLLLWLHDHWKEPVVITRGEDGAVSYDGKTMHTVLGLHIIKSIDAVGAGDAFIAGLAMALAAGASLGEAAEVGNETAGVSVQTLYETGHPTIDEVLEIHKRGDYRYNPELARDKRLAELLPETDIEVIRSSLKGSFDHAYPAVVVFDHDGTISTLRQGWEEVMKRMMVMSIAGSAYNELSSALLEEIELKADQLISKTTGVQTLIQMYELVDLIQESGFIPRKEILSPAEYKSIYNEMLMKNVHKKAERFQSGQLSLEDVTMKGAVEFLKTLREKGVSLYLASGTDQEDVRKEAELLGYADYFNGGIYGSVGDVSRDPKQMVMKGILEKIEERPDIDAERCAVFGDGPVEIREARKHGMLAVGILSDERQRFGRNEAKRERLVLAGSDLLLPDFSCSEEFSRWIGWIS
ncbi:MAG: HAD family hydrolase, partial [Spirochaetales bacterium]|nr:HAD family hydrolase [Spirochaetales bacterium]